jgi:cytochrome c oxidase subunit IV
MSDNHHHYVTPLPVLLATFLALVCLTVLTVFQATQTWVSLGDYEIAITLLIATMKAALVALLFMQLAHDKPMNAIILITSLLFVALFLGFALIDRHEYGPQVQEFVLDNPKTVDNP